MKQLMFLALFCCIGAYLSAQADFRQNKTRGVSDTAINVLAQLMPADAAKFDALNITEFASAMPGGVEVLPNARVSSNEDTARGTNVAPAINAALKAAKRGQFIIIGPGEWVVSTPIELPAKKQVNLICIGNLHFNKRDGFRIGPHQGGPFPQHHLYFYGTLIGRENLAHHSKGTHDLGTQPKWAEMQNTAVDITNSSKNFVLINRADGFGNAVRINGEKGDGSEENTVSFQFFYKNANGITLRSIDGSSYVDHNIFMGFNGGAGRISGGLAINIDGYAQPAANGERYNGAFRSNEFHFLVAQVDSVIVANGDVTEPLFDITVEGGNKTGVYGDKPFQLRSVPPNVVRSPKYCGNGIFNTKWLTDGLGVNGVIMGWPVYYDNHTLLGTNGKTDEKGHLILQTRTKVSQAIRAKLPKNIKLVD